MQEFARSCFIQVAVDCPTELALEPPQRQTGPTLTRLQYELLRAHPYRFNSHEVVAAMRLAQEGVPEAEWGDRLPAKVAEIFAKPQPCLRVSPLAKQYGWGLHIDAEGRVGLVPVGSPEYHAFVEAPPEGLELTRAMRNGKAKA